MSESTKPEQKKGTIDPKDKVPFKEKIAYSCGQVGVGIQEFADNAIIGPVFVIGMGISPALMGVLGLVYRAYDAISDATVGWLTDNTRTRWGRRRPYLFVSSFLMAIVMPLMFMFNPEWDIFYITVWMFTFQLLLTTTQTLYNIPYQCLMLEMTPSSHERTSISAWRSYLGIAVGLFSSWTLWLCMLPYFQPEGQDPSVVNGAPWVMAVFAVLACVLGLVPVFFVRERTYEKAKKQEKVSIFRSMKLTLRNRPFQMVLGFVLTGIVGAGIVGSFGFYLKLYYVCDRDMALLGQINGIEGTLRIISTIIGIRFFQWLSVKTSKKTALIAITVWAIIGSVATYFMFQPGMTYLVILHTVIFAGPTSSAVWVLILSMIGDVVDDEELNSAERMEGSFSAVFSWTQKVTYSLISGLSGFLVVWAGFEVSKRDQPLTDDVVYNMFFLVIGIPLVLKSIALVFLYFYPLSSERIDNTRALLEERRGPL